MSNLADRLRQARTEARLSRNALSVKVGISERTLARYEGGSGGPSTDKVETIARACGVSPEWMLTGMGEMVGLQGYGASVATASRVSERVEASAGLTSVDGAEEALLLERFRRLGAGQRAVLLEVARALTALDD
jgi:transcriptional regulator with XRE-family HTH domain